MSFTTTYEPKARYGVRHLTEIVYSANNTARLIQVGWWVYDWKEYRTVQIFKMGEHKQANGLCKLLNSIEEEANGLSK
jgi:hypothetical protein